VATVLGALTAQIDAPQAAVVKGEGTYRSERVVDDNPFDVSSHGLPRAVPTNTQWPVGVHAIADAVPDSRRKVHRVASPFE
jgi:hypothetical protein